MSNFGDHPAGFFGDSSFYNGVATNSLRLDKASSAYLYRTPSSATNRKTFTVSFWYKTSIVFASTASDQNNPIFYAGAVGTSPVFALNVSAQGQGATSDTLNEMQYYDYDNDDATDYGLETNSSFADPSAWYHLVWAFDTTQGTEANRVKVYINGVQRAYTDMNQHHGAVVQNRDLQINDAHPHWIGRNINTTSRYMNGYLADFNFIDGTQYDASYFGEFKNGIWIPKEPSVTYGTNGFRLQFKNTSVGSGSSSTIGADTSGNNNHFTSSGIVASDCAMPDSPENNFCTLNPLDNDGNTRTGLGLTEGSLKGASTVNGWDNVRSTFTMPTGKWYVELLSTSGIGNGNSHFAIMPSEDAMDFGVSLGSNFLGWTSTVWAYSSNGGWYNNYAGTSSAGQAGSDSTKWAADAIVALTFDGSTLKFYKNNSLIHTIGSIPSADYAIAIGFYDTDESGIINFGQDSSFAGAVTAQGNTDANGIGDFYYEPPSGFLALCSANLPEPTIGPNSATQSDDYFKTALYTGTGSSGNAINTVGFQTDWLWIKRRNGATSHRLIDSSRGVDRYLSSDTTNAEDDATGIFTSFDSNGFTVEGTANATNGNNNPYVSWNWKVNGGTTTTNDASSTGVGTIDSVIQANATAGFSIVTYTGTGSNGTIAHGLGVAPEMVWVKCRSSSGDWAVYRTDMHAVSAANNLRLHSSAAVYSAATMWNSTASTSTVFSVGTNSDSNASSRTYVAYCFASIEGYSKVGSYTGNGNNDGPFVSTGFKPAWVLIKNTARSADWRINDITRQDRNNAGYSSAHLLLANSNSAEITNEYDIDFLSNGFKLRSSDVYENGSGELFVYMAFAEAPFKYSNAH
jgi:hypothetical protein